MKNKSSWNVEKKAFLEPREALAAAYAYLIGGVDQQTLSALYNTNSGRISEAVTVIRHASDNHREIYKELLKQGKAAEAKQDEEKE